MIDIKALAHKPRARSYIANRLNSGSVALFVGAGVSMDAGFPSWKRLMRRCGLLAQFDRRTVAARLRRGDYNAFAEDIRRVARSDRAFLQLIQRGLYSPRIRYNMKLARSRILISIGSLVSGVGKRQISTVVSLNFDDLLEWYFALHGFPTQSIVRLPQTIRSEAISVYHVHGYIPNPSSSLKSSDKLLFTRKEIDERISQNDANPWWRQLRHVLHSKLCLFVGMSEATALDFALTPIFYDAAQSVQGRPTGFWTFGTPLSNENRQHLFDYNIVPLEFNSHSETAEFLLSTCAEAGRLLTTTA